VSWGQAWKPTWLQNSLTMMASAASVWHPRCHTGGSRLQQNLTPVVHILNGAGHRCLLHVRCFVDRVWHSHQTGTLQQELTCPLCRCAWGPFTWVPPPPALDSTAIGSSGSSSTTSSNNSRAATGSQQQQQLPVHKHVKCGSCQQVSEGSAALKDSCPASALS